MGFFCRLFGTDPEGVYKTCVPVYERARGRRPNRPERDYLKLVLLTKPPYDYQTDAVIDQMVEDSRAQRISLASLRTAAILIIGKLRSMFGKLASAILSSSLRLGPATKRFSKNSGGRFYVA
jgi:hypothetical protein